MPSDLIEDQTFKCEKLCIFTIKQDKTVGAKDLRVFIKKHWRDIFKDMTNSTILIIGGVHGSPSGEVGVPEDNMESIEYQVGSEK